MGAVLQFRRNRASSSADNAFTADLVLSLGERSYTIEDRLHVVPVDQLWN